GFFLVGAYQEILGDLHNLFGDTDSVDATLAEDGGWTFSHIQQGDRVADVLSYVNFDAEVLRSNLAEQLAASGLEETEQQHFLDALSEGLAGYTYLE
ncbi:MAG: arginine decarboxylase, partial [Pseudomonadota bacterium]